jgi:hypothetical protein
LARLALRELRGLVGLGLAKNWLLGCGTAFARVALILRAVNRFLCAKNCELAACNTLASAAHVIEAVARVRLAKWRFKAAPTTAP